MLVPRWCPVCMRRCHNPAEGWSILGAGLLFAALVLVSVVCLLLVIG